MAFFSQPRLDLGGIGLEPTTPNVSSDTFRSQLVVLFYLTPSPRGHPRGEGLSSLQVLLLGLELGSF